jgi:Ca2+-binding EF-hand superfamily protein
MKKAVWSTVMLVTCLAVAGSSVAAQGVQQPPKKAQKRLAAQFKKIDLNQDGGVSREEWKKRPKAFDRLDADHDGTLTAQELLRGVKARKRKV